MSQQPDPPFPPDDIGEIELGDSPLGEPTFFDDLGDFVIEESAIDEDVTEDEK
jgi:hypothetical protein